MNLKLDKDEWIEVLETASAWVVTMGMYIYGFAKFFQFNGASDIDTPVSELTGQGLMWAFYGHSLPFALVIGSIEVLGGSLILFKKTRALGSLLLTTVLTNIILQDIFYEVNAGALRAAIIYQSLVLVLLFLNRDRLLKALNELMITKSKGRPFKKTLWMLFLAFILFAIIRVGEFYVSTGS